MNDPVLNRKLFRHQAQIIHNQIPKYRQLEDHLKVHLLAHKDFNQATLAGAQKFNTPGSRSFLKDLRMLVGPGKFCKRSKICLWNL